MSELQWTAWASPVRTDSTWGSVEWYGGSIARVSRERDTGVEDKTSQ